MTKRKQQNIGAKTGKKTPRLVDVARLARTGIATVDRVLNERGSVSPETANRVIEAAKKLGLKRVLPKSYERGRRFNIIMHRKEHEFYRRLSNAFSNISVKLDRSIIIERTFLNAGDYDSLVYELKSRRQSYDGLAILSQMNKDVEFAVEEAVNSGVPVVTLISDLPGSRRSAFIGINNRAAGRAAAHLLSMMTGIDQVYAICTNRSFFDQSERIAGFEEGLKMYACNCKFAVVSEDMIKMEMFRVRSDNDNNIGIYFSGHLNRTATDFLEQNDRINVIAHELTPSNVRYLQNGSLAFVIDQNPEEQARRIIDHMLFHSGVIDMPPSADHVPFSLHGRENAVIPGRGLI